MIDVKSSAQKGFSTVELVLVFVIVAILGGTGYFVYNSQKQTNKTLTSAGSETSAVKASSVKTFADCQKASGSVIQQTYPEVCVTKSGQHFTQPTSNSQLYLTIKEWGVRVKVNSDTSSLYYYISSKQPDNAYVSFKTISDIAPNCAADKTSLAVIFRQTAAQHQDALNNPSDTNVPGTIKLGDYYYGYQHAQAACDDGTTVMENAIAKAQPNTDIASIFQTIESAPAN